jgi:hypothetical protein
VTHRRGRAAADRDRSRGAPLAGRRSRPALCAPPPREFECSAHHQGTTTHVGTGLQNGGVAVLVLGVFLVVLARVLVLVQSVRGVAAGGHPGQHPLLRCHSTDPSDAALQHGLLHLLLRNLWPCAVGFAHSPPCHMSACPPQNIRGAGFRRVCKRISSSVERMLRSRHRATEEHKLKLRQRTIIPVVRCKLRYYYIVLFPFSYMTENKIQNNKLAGLLE